MERTDQMDTVKVRWSSGRQFVGWDAAGHGVVMDASRDHNGEGTGARPMELLLYALAACTGMDVVSILEKKRQAISDLEILVHATQRTDDYPKIYTEIDVEYVVRGQNVQEAAVARAIKLSEEKYCSVRGMLGPQTTVRTSFRVAETEPASRTDG